MGAQIAAAAAAPQMVNGTYGAIGTSGPLSMDGEVLAAPQRTDAQRTGDVGVAGRGSGDTGIGTLKAAAERVMANVAAKVQGVLPPQGRGSSAQGFLQREDTGSAGTHGTGFLTAGSGMPGEQSTPEAQGTSGSGLFSPQQAQRLREMSSEAPLLYAGEGRPVPQRGGAEERQVPPLPHSSSSDSGQAEAIQAEVRKQMQVFMEAQSELQRRVVSLSEENQMLRQEWYTSQYVPSGPVARVRLKPPASEVDKEPRWNRVRHRMEHLILQSCPDAVRAELSSARVSGVLPIMCRLYTVYKPGGVTERAEALRQVQQPRPADSPIDAVMKLRTWKRWMTRLSDLGGTQPDAAVSIQALEGITSGVLKGLPSLSFRVNLVRASLHLDTQPSAGKVEEFFEHLLAELEGVSRVAEPSSGSAAGGGKPDSSKSVRQVEAKAALSGGSEAPQVAQKDKPTKPPTPSGGESPKKPCKWFMEGKGCRRGKDCRFLHDWNQIPKAEKGDRCMLCGGKGHRKDACTVVTGAPLVKRDDGASSAKAMRSDASPKSKGGDPGLRKVLSDAAGVLREAMAVGSAPGDGAVQGAGGTGQASGAEGSEAPTMAVAAKIQAQLEDLEARVLDGGPSIRSVCGNVSEGAGEPTALLDSGATHVVVDDAAAGSQDLVPCTVSLAGDQRQTWHQTPGGSLVAPVTGDGHAPQTILPLGSLVTQLGCSLRWSKREGLQLMHPKLGRLKTSLKGGCPQLSKDQALSLIRELEGVRLGELAGRLKRIQAHLKVSKGLGFRDALDAFVESGSYTSAWTLSKMMPFLEQVPAALVARLVVDLEGANGWELLKGLPFNRRSRKRLHQSHLWLLHLGAGKVDPVLRQMCQMQGVEVVAINLADGSAVDPRVWKALSWAAFTGRLAGIVADAPMRTWNGVRVDDSAAVHLRTSEHPWGLTSNTTAWQSKVEDDTVFSLQPMWLWTIASISKGQGVPFIQTHAVSAPNPNSSWMSSVVNPFTTWSNCSQFQVHEAKEAKGNTRPMVVCSNLGFGENGVRNGSSNEKVAAAPCVPGWSSALRREVTMALFGPNPSNRGGADVETPHVSALDAQLSQVPASSSSPQEEPPPGMEALSPVNEESESSPLPPPVGEKGEGPVPVPERSRPVSKTIAEKDKERWRRHLAAHHVPYRKDCLKCVTAGALGLQHRRVKCPSMYALAFDLAGPFKERGKDEKGGGYKYVLVAGLRVPDIALPGDEVQKPTANSSRPEVSDGGPKQPGIDDDEGSEVSWLNANLEPTAGVMHVSQPDSDTEEDQESIVSWVEMPDLEGLPEPDDEGELDQVEAEPEGVPEGHRAPELEGDLWEDTLGVADMSDEQFDDALSQLLFKGANKVLRFAVPVKSRKGPQILAALQEVVTECNRLGFPVKIAHTDRAKELMSKATVEWLQSKLIQPSFTQGDDPQSNGLAERLVGWVKARARLHLAASGLGVEQWPAAMSFACAEHRNRMLQVDTKLPRFGQKVVFKSKHPTGRSKRPFIRWEHAVYLCPTPRTEGGHVLQRALSGAYLVAKNVRCIENLVDPEAELGDETVVEVDAPDELPRASEDGQPSAPSRRITGKRAVRAISLPAETTARDFLRNGWFTPDHCGRLLEMAFGGTEAISRRTHRGPMELAVVLGAYGHGGLHGVTRASRVYPEVCRYLNEYLRRNLPPGQSHPQWSALTVVVAPEVAVHRDVRNEPGSVNYVTQVTTRSMWIEGATEAGLEQMCADEKGIERKGYWMPLTQVTSTFDPKQRHSVLPLDEEQFEMRMARSQLIPWDQDPELIVNGPAGPVLAARVLDYSDDGPPDETPFPDRMIMFSVHDLVRDVTEMVILRVVLVEEEPRENGNPLMPVLEVPGPPPPEVRVVQCADEPRKKGGAPVELVRASLVQACRHGWWLVELGLASSDEYYSLGKVLYGFKEAPAWWSDHRDTKLLTASFLGCHLEQGTSDPSLWRIMKGEDLKGFLVTYVDDFLILSDGSTARGLHQWLLEGAGWETDGLSEARPGEPVRFLGMQLERHEDGHFSLNQESYVDELVRAYGLASSDKSKVVCPKEILMSEPESAPKADEATIKAAQKIAGECLWLSQRTRFDICFTTAILCSRVSKDPQGALMIGRRLLCYLHQTKSFKLHLRPDDAAAPVRVFTDASFSPQGQHSYGGHVVELFGVPAVWRASRQALIALSSSEAELIQAVEGCMYAESLLTVLQDLRVQCSTVQLLLDNTASIAFIGGSSSQRTRHLKVRAYKIRQLIQSGWEVKHCRGEYQRADLLTKPLPAARMRFLCDLLQPELPRINPRFVRAREKVKAMKRREPTPQVRAVSIKERRAKKLQDRVAAAIDSAVSESPTGDEGRPAPRKGRNKCPSEVTGAESGT
ncbi:GIP, partial [Symbiodinium microadriaticum]